MEAEQEYVETQGDFAEINAPEEVQQGEQPEINFEERAKLQGWVPVDEFRGDKEKHISAQEFVERADHMMPILKGVNRKLETKLTERDKQLEETQETLKRVVSMQEKVAKDAYESARREIEAKKLDAVESGDTETYTKLDKQEKELVPPELPKQGEKPPEPPPEMQRWFDDNSWFKENEELRNEAIAMGEVLAKMEDPLAVPGKEYEFGEKIKSRVQALFPDKFSNPNRQNSEFDEGSTGGGGNQQTGKKGWSDLPQEAQRQCKLNEQNIPGYTREMYLNDYFEEE